MTSLYIVSAWSALYVLHNPKGVSVLRKIFIPRYLSVTPENHKSILNNHRGRGSIGVFELKESFALANIRGWSHPLTPKYPSLVIIVLKEMAPELHQHTPSIPAVLGKHLYCHGVSDYTSFQIGCQTHP